MDQQIKKALEQRASEATVPGDAWERQRAILQKAGAVGTVRRPWWRRLGTLAEVAVVAVLMVGLVGAGIVYGPLGPGGGDGGKGGTQAEDPVDPVDAPADLNPVVTPQPQVVDAPPTGGTPLRGNLTQEQAVELGRKAILEHNGVHGGPLPLTNIALKDGMWALKYRADWHVFTDSHGKPVQDPRRPESSHLVPLTDVTVEIDDAAGTVYSFGMTSDPSHLTGLKLELEHYRGRILSGGERTELRLTNADGTREGRDLTVWVLNQALGKNGMHQPNDDTLKLWHLIYGVGREIDVYGLTIAPGEVLAYRVEMKQRPGWDLGGLETINGIPLPAGATPSGQKFSDGVGYILAGYTPESLKGWYLEQMPRYGWELGKPVPSPTDDPKVYRFVAYGWQFATVAIRPDPQGVQFDLHWGDVHMPVQNQQQALGAVFRELGDAPTFLQFPRTPGSAPGTYSIGGPPPGQTMPATYETRVQTMADGAWEVDLAIIWGKGPYTFIQGFRVEQDGIVHRLGQWGEQPPAIP